MTYKILTIDDELLILKTVAKALSKIGYAVTTAQNIEDLDRALGNAPFDLLITDLHMEGETADNIVDRVRRTSPSIRVLYMSGTANKTGEDNFIEKPFKLGELREKVKAALHEST